MSVEVTYLPTIGEAYSIKTNKQGRTENISEVGNPDPLYTVKRGGGVIVIGNRSYRREGSAVVVSNAKRIINFKHSTPRQIASANNILNLIEKGCTVERESKLILGITRSLSKRYREF